jgi:hypothetical protein
MGGQSGNMAPEVSALMSAADEEEWAWDGLFQTVDELSNKSGGGRNSKRPLSH